MDLPDWTKDKRLQHLSFLMGVRGIPVLPEVEFATVQEVEQERTQIQQEEVELYEKLSTAQVKVKNVHQLKHGLREPLEHEGKNVLAYIYEPSLNYENDLETYKQGKSPRRFHLLWCGTLDQMRKDGRENRYCATRRTDGRALVAPKDKEPSVLGMKLCQNCRSGLKHLGRSIQGKAYEEDYETYFKKYDAWDISHIPENTTVRVKHYYTPDHAEVAKRYKEIANWICQGCFVDLSAKANRHLLHLHHIDAVESNNEHDNLRVLCVQCHSNQMGHSHMKGPFKSKINKVIKIRKQQAPPS